MNDKTTRKELNKKSNLIPFAKHTKSSKSRYSGITQTLPTDPDFQHEELYFTKQTITNFNYRETSIIKKTCVSYKSKELLKRSVMKPTSKKYCMVLLINQQV